MRGYLPVEVIVIATALINLQPMLEHGSRGRGAEPVQVTSAFVTSCMAWHTR